jgi:hypothetical protein
LSDRRKDTTGAQHNAKPEASSELGARKARFRTLAAGKAIGYPKGTDPEDRPPWAGTPFEAPLMRIKIPGASEQENTQLWDYIYGEVQQAGRCFRGEVPSRQIHPSKEAATRRKLAQKCKELALELRRYDPLAADTLTDTGDGLLIDSDTFADRAKTTKRHSRHSETQHILLAMGRIHQQTGKFHDGELRELLALVRINVSPEALRGLRARSR